MTISELSISKGALEALERRRQILEQFKDHRERGKKLFPPFTWREMLKLHNQAGEVIEVMIQEEMDKKTFLNKLRQFAKTSQEDQRMFLIETPQDLYDVLFAVSMDGEYAAEQRDHESEHAALYRSFKPKPPYKSPDVLFGVMTFSDGCFAPYAIYSRQLPSMPLLESHKTDPLRLMKEWDLETIREFWLYLRRGVVDGSTGDKALLRK